MSAKVLTEEAAKKAGIALITEPAKGRQAVHDAVVGMQANRRRGTASTKTKADVSYTGAKPWRQKGTGRARAGYKSSPVWSGGGVAFGPHPRSYAKHVPKKVKTLAFRKALSERTLAGDVLVVDAFSVPQPKTKQFIALLDDHAKGSKKVLVVSNGFDENTLLAGRNVAHAQLARAHDVNTEQLLAYDKILLTGEALATISERLSK
jgi:large subunit ribosomal protein L4